VSCRTTSKDELAITIPVSPPNVNIVINPKDHNIDIEKVGVLPFIVDNHLNTFTPVGTAITIVADVK